MTSLSEKSQVNFAPDKPPPVLPLEERSTEWTESNQCPGTKFGTSAKTVVEDPDHSPPVLPFEESKVSAELPNSSQCPKLVTSVETAVEGPIIEFDFESTETFTDSSEEEATVEGPIIELDLESTGAFTDSS